jgi:hypothetical protein
MIPKVIYQTWKTKNLSPEQILIKNKIKELNPEYDIILYDDNDIDIFIKNNYDIEIYNTFKLIKLGAMKADYWRLLILYKYGGIYLDFDSSINKSLNELIRDDDDAIISREKNLGLFVQWCLIFKKEHPILLDCINRVTKNINNLFLNKNKILDKDIIYCSGPKALADSINSILKPYYNKLTNNLYFENDNDLNNDLNNIINIKSRFIGYDYNDIFQFKHEYNDLLYINNKSWRQDLVNVFN